MGLKRRALWGPGGQHQHTAGNGGLLCSICTDILMAWPAAWQNYQGRGLAKRSEPLEEKFERPHLD